MASLEETNCWETEYSQEAANYLLDNGQLIADLYFALEALDGQLAPSEFQVIEGLQMAIIENHAVAFWRDVAKQIVCVASIKPPE